MMLSPSSRRLLVWMLPLLGLAALLRLVGIGHGLPHAAMADDVTAGAGLIGQMLAATDGPGLLSWVSLLLALPVMGLAWLWNGLPTGAGFEAMVAANLDIVVLIARLCATGASLATVLLVALIARRVFGDRLAGIAAGLLMATS